MSAPCIHVEGVGKRYTAYASSLARFAGWFGAPVRPSSEFWAVKGIDFQLPQGEALALVGQNGAGKSTLLKLITGTTKPTVGSIAVNGRVSAILELGLGFSPELTGRENAFQAGGMMGYSHSDLAVLMPAVEAFAELGGFFDQPLRVFSSGMQARLAFSLATAMRPEVLIIDEVLSVGDAYFQAKCFDRIASFKRQGTTLLLVSHSINDIVRHADRALLMRNGEMDFLGDPREACNLYLDSLFGKRVAGSAGSHESSISLSTGADVFSTRPGYRKEEHRWGHGGAKIIDFLVRSSEEYYPATVQSNATADIYYSVVFEEAFDDVTAGILLKTLDGLFVYGTNSYLTTHGKGEINVRAGERRTFRFTMPMDLAAGHYLLSFGVSVGPQENLTPLDRRYDSVILTVDRPMGFWGLCDLRASFSVLQEE